MVPHFFQRICTLQVYIITFFLNLKYLASINLISFFLIGDSNSLSNWEYKDNPPLAILMVLFSIITAVYLMNLLIGLLSNAIEKDNNRTSYLMNKATVL